MDDEATGLEESRVLVLVLFSSWCSATESFPETLVRSKKVSPKGMSIARVRIGRLRRVIG